MKLQLSQEILLKASDLVAKAASKHHRFIILSNIKFVLSEEFLTLTASDLEVEMTTRIRLPQDACIEAGMITINAATFHEICRSLPAGDILLHTTSDGRCVIKSGDSIFTLSTLPADDYPSIGTPELTDRISIKRQDLYEMIARTRFAMATQDVRHYLTGMLFHVNGHNLTTVATDGHRLAIAQRILEQNHQENQIIVPGKAVIELERLFNELGKMMGKDDMVTLGMDNEFLQVSLNFAGKQEDGSVSDDLVVSMTARLIEGQFPDYRRVIPNDNDKVAIINKDSLMNALRRVSIVSDERSRGVIFDFNDSSTVVVRSSSISADKADEAVETLGVDYQGEPIELSLNEAYLKAVLSVLAGEISIAMSKPNNATLITQIGDDLHQYVVMPMRI